MTNELVQFVGDPAMEPIIKLLSTKGGFIAFLVWIHLRTQRMEKRLEMMADHLNAPQPVKRKYRGPMLLLLSVILAALSGGCGMARLSHSLSQ